MSDLSPETDKLLELARGASTLSDVRRAQIKAGLLSQIAAGGALGGAAGHAAWGKAAWLAGPLAKGLSALALLSAVGVGVGFYVSARAPKVALEAPAASAGGAALASTPADPALREHGSDAVVAPGANAATGSPSSGASTAAQPPGLDPSHAAEPLAAALPTPPTGGSSTGSPKALVGASHGAPASESTSSSAVAAPTADTLAAETRLLRDADQALRAGNAQRALVLLDEHATRFPHGVLEPERSAERMIARCKLGQVDAKSAQSYLAAHASSSFAARLQDACGAANR